MARTLATAKNGQYNGPGDALDWLQVGAHDRGGIDGFPANPWAAYKHWYGFAESASYTAADFTTRTTGTGAAIAMTAAGLLFTTGSAASTDDAQAQALRGFTPAAGKRAYAFARLQISDITHPLVAFGWSNTVTDYGAGESTDNALFLMAAGGATIVGRSKDGATGSSTSTLLTAVAATDVDLCVVIDGVSAVEFRYKLATSSTWLRSRKTTNLPAANQRLTLAVGAGQTGASTVTVARWGFWAEHTVVV